MTPLLEALPKETVARLRCLALAAENTDWPTPVARARDWRAANATYHAHQRAQGYIEMDRLLAALGLRPPLPPQRRRALLHIAIAVYLQTEATTAVARMEADGIQLEVSRCPLFDRFDDPAWVGVTACGCFARIKGWHDALGVPADIELVANRKWDDPVCQVVLHLPDADRVDGAPESLPQTRREEPAARRAGG